MAFRVLKDAMYPACAMKSEDSQRLKELHELEYREAILESVDFVLVDFPNKVHCSHADENWEHVGVSGDDMGAGVAVVWTCSEARGHGHLFCTVLEAVQ